MKKTVTVMLAVAFGAFIAQAQTTSDNVVGYVKHSTEAGLQMQGIQFTGDSAITVQGLYGDTLPVGSKIYTYAAGSGPYDIATYNAGFFGLPDSWDKNIALPLGSAVWVQLPVGASAVEVVQAGEVSSDASHDTSIVTGLQLLANPYPVTITVQNAGFSPAVGDKVYVYSNGSYNIATYNAGFFGLPDSWDQNIAIPAGAGFWYQAQDNQTWSASSPL